MLNYDKQVSTKQDISTLSDGKFADVTIGLFCVLTASLISGISAALTQRALTFSQDRKSNSFLLSAELAVYGIIFLLAKEFITFLFDMVLKTYMSYITVSLLPVIVTSIFILILIISICGKLCIQNTYNAIFVNNFFQGWTLYTCLPIIMNV